MKGASGLPLTETTSSPSSTSTKTIGASQNFLRTRRNAQNSRRTDSLDIGAGGDGSQPTATRAARPPGPVGALPVPGIARVDNAPPWSIFLFAPPFTLLSTPDPKRAVGEAAARLVEPGMCLGLGTGSTTAFAIEVIGARVRREGLRVAGVPTSFAAERLARQHGVPLLSLDSLNLDRLAPGAPALDLALDGADEVSPALDLIKGRGAAHVREKVVAALAARFVVLADATKLVNRLGTTMPVPVEVLPMAEAAVARALVGLGAQPVLRMGQRKDGPVVTDQGFWILDAHLDGGIDDPAALGQAIDAIPGVLGHGLFVGMASEALVGRADGRTETLTARSHTAAPRRSESTGARDAV